MGCEKDKMFLTNMYFHGFQLITNLSILVYTHAFGTVAHSSLVDINTGLLRGHMSDPLYTHRYQHNSLQKTLMGILGETQKQSHTAI